MCYPLILLPMNLGVEETVELNRGCPNLEGIRPLVKKTPPPPYICQVDYSRANSWLRLKDGHGPLTSGYHNSSTIFVDGGSAGAHPET